MLTILKLENMTQFKKVLAFLLLLSSASCGGTPYYRAAPIDATLVDAETNLPIEGVNVVANWQLVVGGLDGQRKKGQLEVRETTTDKAGRLHFDGFTKLNPKFYELRGEDPQIIVFKGGYEYQRISNDYGQRYPGANRQAAINGTVVQLKKLAPAMMGQVKRYHVELSIDLNPIVEDCEWKKIPRMIMAMDAEKERIKSMSPDAVVGGLAIRDLERLKNKCGSAIEFFRSYKK